MGDRYQQGGRVSAADVDDERNRRALDRQAKLKAVADAHYKWEQKAAKERTDLWNPDHEYGPDYPNHHLDVEANASDSADFWDEVDRIFSDDSPAGDEGSDDGGSEPEAAAEPNPAEPNPAGPGPSEPGPTGRGRVRRVRSGLANPAASPPRSGSLE